MDAAVLYLWDSHKSIILFSIVVELISFPLWMYLARLIFNENVCRSASLLYVLSPLPLFATAVSGQNQSFGAAYLGVAILLLIRGRDSLAGFVMGLAIPGVKFLMVLFAPVTWAFARARLKFLLAWLILPVLTYALLWFTRADITVPFQIQGNDQTSGNLPFLVGLLGVDTASPISQRCFDLFTLIALAIVFLFHMWRTKTEEGGWLIDLCVVVGLTFMLCSKKSYTTYLVLFFFPLCMSIVRSGFSVAAAVHVGIINCIAALEPSLSFRWIMNPSSAKIPSLAFLSRLHEMPIVISVTFIAINLALVSFYLQYVIRISRGMYWRKESTPAVKGTVQTEVA